jgi:histone H3/H4
MKQQKKILNFNGIRRFLTKKFPNLILENRSKQFIESFIISYLKNILKESCLFTKHRKSQILQVQDLKAYFFKNLDKFDNFSFVHKKFTRKKNLN